MNSVSKFLTFWTSFRQFSRALAFFSFFFWLIGSVFAQLHQIQCPYDGIEWEKVMHVPSVSHYHGRNQNCLDKGYDAGIRHFAFSNYYPSVPVTPDERGNQYLLFQDFPIYRKDKLLSGTFRWNEILMNSQTGWFNVLPEKQKNSLPFKLLGPIFPRVPAGIIISPNAEHHHFLNTRAHVNSLGSKFSSGNFDANGKYQLAEHGFPIGSALDWQLAFRKMINQMLFYDGGGIIINHPRWSGLKLGAICEMLDFDKNRVLGIEVWNHSAEKISKKGWSLEEWDAILSTGRRCLGFFVSDHEHENNSSFLGRNILLVRSMTEANLLRAYRQGCFYGSLKGSSLRFEKIYIKNGALYVKTTSAQEIRFIGKGGLLKTVKKKNADFIFPLDFTGKVDLVYLRIEASDDDGEIIFSQPIMFCQGS